MKFMEILRSAKVRLQSVSRFQPGITLQSLIILLSGIILLSVIVFVPSEKVSAEGVSVKSAGGNRIYVFENAKPDSQVEGNIIVVGGNLEIAYPVKGHVLTVFCTSDVKNIVNGQYMSVFGNLKLNKNAIIKGNTFSVGLLYKPQGAQILGREIKVLNREMALDRQFYRSFNLIFMLLYMGVVFIAGILLITLLKERYNTISALSEQRPLRKLAVGFTGFLCFAVLSVLLFITIIAPVALIVLSVIAEATSAVFFGRKIFSMLSFNHNVFLELISGLFFINLVRLVLIMALPISIVLFGTILFILTMVTTVSLGIGLLVDTRFGTCKTA